MFFFFSNLNWNIGDQCRLLSCHSHFDGRTIPKHIKNWIGSKFCPIVNRAILFLVHVKLPCSTRTLTNTSSCQIPTKATTGAFSSSSSSPLSQFRFLNSQFSISRFNSPSPILSFCWFPTNHLLVSPLLSLAFQLNYSILCPFQFLFSVPNSSRFPLPFFQLNYCLMTVSNWIRWNSAWDLSLTLINLCFTSFKSIASHSDCFAYC